METKFKEEEINEGWGYVHSLLGFRIWDDIQGIKQRLIDGDKILKKMETMTESLLKQVSKTETEFMEVYNSNPSLYKQIIINEYVSEYKERFHVLYDFHIELNDHRVKLESLLNKSKNKKNKTEQDIAYINVLKEYISFVKDKSQLYI
jgi:hypothetical protein